MVFTVKTRTKQRFQIDDCKVALSANQTKGLSLRHHERKPIELKPSETGLYFKDYLEHDKNFIAKPFFNHINNFNACNCDLAMSVLDQ